MLEKFIQHISQDPVIGVSDQFNDFFVKAQQVKSIVHSLRPLFIRGMPTFMRAFVGEVPRFAEKKTNWGGWEYRGGGQIKKGVCVKCDNGWQKVLRQ